MEHDIDVEYYRMLIDDLTDAGMVETAKDMKALLEAYESKEK